MKNQIILIFFVSALLIGFLVYIGPFNQSLGLQLLFLFFTGVMAFATYKNKYKVPFVVLSVSFFVSLSSIMLLVIK
ncbi:hypothetical protein AM506_21295 [Rossellomorea vietnamensis]|uniref:Uncharacterized protein n=1 Tax=Rossellomorea vietnamensis TaxID=218284 RepID=A0A0P6VTH8_9BACI|nr:hypothetical protein AM506_21295 [Rossellomorea vietnamensis]